MAQKYKNIPVKPETYAKVQLLAGANNRGLGDQVTEWVTRDLPACEHKKQAVSIETFPNDMLHPSLRQGWFCPICNRVYSYQAASVGRARGKRASKAVAS